MRGFDLAAVGGDKDRHPATRIAQRGDEMRQLVLLARDLQPALGRAFLALFGDDADGVGFVAQGDFLHLVGRGHLEIQRRRQDCHQPFDIGVADVAAIFAQVGGDAVSPRILGQFGGPDRVGRGAATRIAHGGDVIDIDAQSQFVLTHPSLLFAALILTGTRPAVRRQITAFAQLHQLGMQRLLAALLVGGDQRHRQVIGDGRGRS